MYIYIYIIYVHITYLKHIYDWCLEVSATIPSLSLQVLDFYTDIFFINT
jgi:hypothetical protein